MYVVSNASFADRFSARSSQKPIYLTPKYQNQKREWSPGPRTTVPYQPRRRSLSPRIERDRGHRPLTAGRTWPSLEKPGGEASNTRANEYRPRFNDRKYAKEGESHGPAMQNSAASSSDLHVTDATLQILRQSSSLQALLSVFPKPTDVSDEFNATSVSLLTYSIVQPPIKQEEIPVKVCTSRS